MSLFVVLKSKRISDGKPNCLERHLPFGDSLPALINEEIDFIQADCGELEYIVSMFSAFRTFGEDMRVVSFPTIPVPSHVSVMVWYGGLAKTIYYNLRNTR